MIKEILFLEKNETIEMKSKKISTLPVAEANTVLGSVVSDQAMSLLSLSLKKMPFTRSPVKIIPLFTLTFCHLK